MRMALALSVTLAQGACVATAPLLPGPAVVPAVPEPLRVTNAGQPFRMWDGALARSHADARCGPRGVSSSIRDRFDPATAAWVFPEGCA